MDAFKAFRVHADKSGVSAGLETIGLDDLTDGEVVIRGEWSSINYKDALAATGAGKILRKSPLVGGVDISGTVVSSTDKRVAEGQTVVVCSCGLSEIYDGGFAEYARIKGEFVIPLPAGLDSRAAMAIGTAGFTAALALERMEHNGQTPSQGPVAITGATGGVGTTAVDIFASRGYTVTALTSKTDADDFLRDLGATEIVHLGGLDLGTRPLEKALWAGAVDNLGGGVLSWLTRTMQPNGNIASIGLAASHELSTTVMPFILRGVNLLGINSVDVPREKRVEIWSRLAAELRPRRLDRIVTREVTLDELPAVFQAYIDGAVTGRTIVRLASPGR